HSNATAPTATSTLSLHDALPIYQAFNRRFERLRDGYAALLAWALGHRRIVAGVFAGFVSLSLGLFWLIGMDFFPTVDAGQLRLRSEEHTSELQSLAYLVCRLLLE